MRRSFAGPLPDWLDPETAGWSFRQAASIFGARKLTLDNRETFKPDVRSEWWEENDVHTPVLLMDLRRGELVAFGDPGRAGARPEWIARRLWIDLVSDHEKQSRFEGGGNIYWNVRVIPAGEISAMEQVEEIERDITSERPHGRKKNGGGRPVLPAQYLFIAELVRIADVGDLPPDRRAVNKMMLDWCAVNLEDDDRPTERTVQSWVQRFTPHLKP